ncbi:MAG TPA: acyl-CoA dehydrogenase, partial [Polyangiaceae bacterium]|nr:acyl-CoA dehydrogenase [Polyangiaceae bacterium]
MKHRQDRDELAGVQTALRAILEPFGPEYWQQVERDKAFPTEAYDKLGEAGWYGTLIPEAYGGSDAGPAVASLVVEEINRRGGDAAVFNAQMAICGTLVRDGSDEQRKRYLPGVATGEVRFMSVAATEPDSGADMSSLESTARQDGDDWVIDAKKVMISLA